jgi:hypothetical protein
MKPAAEFQQIGRVFFWEAYDPAVKTDLSSCAILAPAGLIFVDPIALEKEALAELGELAPAAAIVLTNGNHARSAADFREHFQVPVCAHAEAIAGLELAVDRELAEGDAVAGDARVVALPGAGAGEIALVSAGGGLHFGDALIHLEPYGLSILPEKYCLDAPVLRNSLRKLLRFPCDVLTFAHGLPLVTQAQQRLAQLLS